MSLNQSNKIIVSIPKVNCFKCGKALDYRAVWAVHYSGVYCVGCAPVGSRLFAE